MDVSGTFIHKCQNLKATTMFFGKSVKKLWFMNTTEYYSALKKNELSSHEETWKNLKYTLLREKCPSNSDLLYDSNCDVLKNAKMWETVKRSVIARG